MARSNNPNRTIPCSFARGMYSGGDAAAIPQGTARRLRNVLLRSRVIVKRPCFKYDGLSAARGVGIWSDSVTGARRLVAVSSTGGVSVKDASGEAWTSGGTAPGAADMLDSASYRGKLLLLEGTSAHVPSGVNVFNGVTTETTYLSGSNSTELYPATIAIHKERAFYGGSLLSFINYLHDTGSGNNHAYDASDWSLTNITSANVTIGSATRCRITPTSTTAASMIVQEEVPAGYFDTEVFKWLGELQNTSPTYRMPMSLQLVYSRSWITDDVVAVGQIVTPSTPNAFRYRCIVAGATDATTEPTWPTTVGATVTDGATTWICDGSNVAASTEIILPTASESSSFTQFSVTATVLAGSVTGITTRLKFGTTATPTITLASVDFSLIDGRADGDVSKENHGHQLTIGHLAVPFINRDDAGNYTPDPVDTIFWSEVAQPERVLALNTFKLGDTPGAITTIRSGVAGKLLVFKRSAAYVFASVDDARTVILPEGDARSDFGCLGPKAFAAFEDRAYFIGENEIYVWSIGEDPVPLCGFAMQEEVMSKSDATWCEFQSAPGNRALLEIDQRNREMWVYTQKGVLFCYQLDAKAWTAHDVDGGYEICDMAYNPTTGNMYFAFTNAPAGTAGIARLDATAVPAEDSISTSGTTPVVAEVWPRAIEAMTPAADVQVDVLRFYHKATDSQSGQIMRGDVSFDQGVSFAKSLTFNLAPLSTGGFVPISLPVFQAWNTVQTRIVHTGKGGASNFSVSRIEADVMVMRGFYPKTAVASGASTL